MKKKRILWLFNHTSLRKFEVPMLIEMGYEVYCPKICDIEYGDFSTSISYEYDRSLSLDSKTLNKLNLIDFYNELTAQNVQLINETFDVIITGFFMPVIDYLLDRFNGILLIHVFGLAGEATYTQLLKEYGGNQIFSKIKRMKNRFWFAPSYENISEIECEIIKNRTIYLPIGLSMKTNLSWVGGEKKLLFVGPKIESNGYYNEVYLNFKKNFKDIPHVIHGGQPIEVKYDDTVTGFLSREDYNYNMTHLSCMFYHSQEPRHLHYHPLEAIKIGMPLIFMSGGMLDYLGGKKLPGRCASIKEAREKIQRVINGDKRLIEKITSSQNILLEKFDQKYCCDIWKKGLERIENANSDYAEKTFTVKKLAIVMPSVYLGGVFDYTIRMIKIMDYWIKKNKDNIKIVFAYPEDEMLTDSIVEKALSGIEVEFRRFHVKNQNNEWFKRNSQLIGCYAKYDSYMCGDNKISVMYDGICDFSDVHYIIFTSDLLGNDPKPVYTPVPYSMIVHDYIQRYIPNVFSQKSSATKLINQKNADKVIVTSIHNYSDALEFAGIKKEKLILTNNLFEFKKMEDVDDFVDIKSDYFLWSTNVAVHKNHLKALEALKVYYKAGGNIKCVITGVNTNEFKGEYHKDTSEYAKRIHNLISNNKILSNNIIIKGNLPKEEYYSILKNAKFIFHPGYGDNGNFTISDGVAMKVPSLCSDYPGMRSFCDFLELKPLFFDPFDVDDISEKLLYMENNYVDYSKILPKFDRLSKKSYKSISHDIYSKVKYISGL